MAESCVSIHKTVQCISGGCFHLLFERTETVFHINDMLLGGDQLFIDGMMTVDVLILGKIADIFIFGKDNVSGIRRDFVHDDTQQSGFAGTIVTDQCGFFPVFYMETCIFKDYFFAKGFTDVLT